MMRLDVNPSDQVDDKYPGLKRLIFLVLVLTVIQGCSTLSSPIASISRPEIAPSSEPVTPRIIDSTAPKERQTKTPAAITGVASWYGPGFSGKKTANGEIFDETKMTAAHKTLPLGTKAKVTNVKNGKSVEVEINDRGPYAEGRLIDLSQAAAAALGIVDRGIATVRVESMNNTLLTGDVK
jgi:rare lipoprotein A